MRTRETRALYLAAPRLNQLHILKEIASNSEITQAELARRCSLSVAMVNNYMKELCSKGLLEYRRKSSKSVSYHITGAGREAMEFTQRDQLKELVALFNDIKARIKEALSSQGCENPGRVVLYGCGDLAELALFAMSAFDWEVVGVCDDDPARIGVDWHGRAVLHPSRIQFLSPDAIVVTKQGDVDPRDIDLDRSNGDSPRIAFIDHLRLDSDLTAAAPLETTLSLGRLEPEGVNSR